MITKHSNITIYTHNDLDGIGCAILAKMAFPNCTVKYCGNSNIDSQMMRDLDIDLKNADYIFVTDICPTASVLDALPADITSKMLVLDHHDSRQALADMYDFVKVITHRSTKRCSGTSLFYEYLVDNYHLDLTPCVTDFCELVRQYDTWEWTTNNNPLPNDLNILWQLYGDERFETVVTDKLRHDEYFEFSARERQTIDEYKVRHQQKVAEYADAVIYGTLDGVKCGLVYAEDEYKNDISGELKKRHSDIDFLAIAVPGKQSLSLRTVNVDFDLTTITSVLGGGGRKDTASCPVDTFAQHFISNYTHDSTKGVL